MSNVGTPEWEAACDAYIASMNSKTPEQTAHADCDHGYGYCTQTATNAFTGSAR